MVVPLHLIRELYETFRNFKIRVADYLRYRKITSNMNDRFPDATPEELTASDATCIICREEMTSAKKLICGHLFHVHCLRSWLERQHTCPTCRALVVPPENGTSSSGRQHGTRSDAHQQGSSTSSATQGPGVDVATDNLTRHQARLQAAAAAASIYDKSYVYPSASTLAWSPGNAVLPGASAPLADSMKAEYSGENTSIGQQQIAIPGGHANVPFPQFPHCVFVPFQLPGANGNSGEGSGTNHYIPDSQLEAQKKIIQQQIQVLQHQLLLLQMQKPKTGESPDVGLTASSDSKGKTVASEE